MSTFDNRIIDLAAYRGQRAQEERAASEFAQLAKFIMAHRGSLSNAAVTAEASSREGNLGPKLAGIVKSSALHGIISREAFLHEKAAVVAGGLTASPSADFSAISAAFINSLVNVGAMDAMISSMVPIPLSTGTAGQVTTGAQAYALAEGSAKPITRLSFSNQQFTPQKAHCAGQR